MGRVRKITLKGWLTVTKEKKTLEWLKDGDLCINYRLLYNYINAWKVPFGGQWLWIMGWKSQ